MIIQYLVYAERIGSPGDGSHTKPIGIADSVDAALEYVSSRLRKDLAWLAQGAPLYDCSTYRVVPVEKIERTDDVG